MNKRILFVRNITTSSTLRDRLEDMGFEVKELSALLLTTAKAAELQPVLIIFETTSWSIELQRVLAELLSMNRTRKIRKIILSERSGIDDSVAALESGADDFLGSCCSDREKIARIHSVLRSIPQNHVEEDEQRLGSLLLSSDRREISIAGKWFRLTPKEFGILSYLLEASSHVVTREELLDNLWCPARRRIGRRIIDAYILRLRQKIEVNPAEPRRLVTRRGGGYQLIDPDL